MSSSRAVVRSVRSLLGLPTRASSRYGSAFASAFSAVAPRRTFAVKNKKKEEKNKQRDTSAIDTSNLGSKANDPFTKACLEMLRPATEEEKWFEDRTPEQVEKDTFYYKEIQRRRTRMHRKLDHHLHTKIKRRDKAIKRLPPWLTKSALIEDKEMLPLDSIQPWSETPPIPGYKQPKNIF